MAIPFATHDAPEVPASTGRFGGGMTMTRWADARAESERTVFSRTEGTLRKDAL